MLRIRKGIYAGSFDPITRGHVDMVNRTLALVEELVVGVGYNVKKTSGLFSADERVTLIEGALDEAMNPDDRARVSVSAFNGLLVRFAEQNSAGVIFRGIRAAPDFDTEFEIHGVNRGLAPEIETVYLMAPPELLYVSSSMVRELALHGGEGLGRYVTQNVEDALTTRLR